MTVRVFGCLLSSLLCGTFFCRLAMRFPRRLILVGQIVLTTKVLHGNIHGEMSTGGAFIPLIRGVV